ncbi:MAG: outer membrane beta-barrel protein [Melioribacter sp.]|uniref:outer membrane protein n=1 Tax=Rosettibacter primus TaxID=3111523 RepID=UPI00247D863C|nr:outer membrane beta-barrel protein [Melioribacter sp.]
MLKKTVLLLFVTIFSFASLKAQTIAIGPQLGYHKSEDAEGSLLLGAMGRIYLANSLALEASINYRSEDYENGGVKTKMYPVMVSGLLYFFPLLYGTIGAGWYNTKIDYSNSLNSLGFKDETKSEFGYHLGIGAELGLGNLILTGDVRYVFLNLKLDRLPGVKELKNNFYVITAGVLFEL